MGDGVAVGRSENVDAFRDAQNTVQSAKAVICSGAHKPNVLPARELRDAPLCEHRTMHCTLESGA